MSSLEVAFLDVWVDAGIIVVHWLDVASWLPFAPLELQLQPLLWSLDNTELTIITLLDEAVLPDLCHLRQVVGVALPLLLALRKCLLKLLDVL